MVEKRHKLGRDPDFFNQDQEFIRLLLSNQKRIYGFILSLLPNPTDADDIMQETATVLWRRFHEFEQGTHFSAWAIGIARNKILQWRTKQAREGAKFSDKALEEIALHSTQIMETMDERMEALRECIGRLKEGDRQVLCMRYQSEGSLRQLAGQLGRSADGFYKTMARIHRRLQECVRRSIAHGEAL